MTTSNPAFAEAVAFFYNNAAYSYVINKETPAEGRKRCALALAQAERDAISRRLIFRWSHDDITDESFRDTNQPYLLWQCVCLRDEKILSNLGGIDLGPDGLPANPEHLYARVVEAELALEALPLIPAEDANAE